MPELVNKVKKKYQIKQVFYKMIDQKSWNLFYGTYEDAWWFK